jgi:XTP/dITP diphosphohydrolase
MQIHLDFMANFEEKKEAFARLLTIMDELREKCPWDKKQTLQSLRYLSIEELYELSDAILDEDYNAIKGELGDLMLHLVFYAKIADEQKQFDIAEVLHAVCDKLVHRHPHIYGDVVVENEEEVKSNWEKLKLKEGKKSALEGAPKSLPAMVKANRIQEKARGMGFDWDNKEQVWEKVQEEIQELKNELDKEDNHAKIENEFGDVLFSLINYARFIGVNPEDALEKTNRKFISRFQYLEEKTIQQGKNLKDMSLAEMDVFWEEAKKQKKQ